MLLSSVDWQALHTGRVEAAFRMAVEEGVQGVGAGGGGGGREGVHGEEARRLTVEDRADLWEWFEEFVEDLSMDIAKARNIKDLRHGSTGDDG